MVGCVSQYKSPILYHHFFCFWYPVLTFDIAPLLGKLVVLWAGNGMRNQVYFFKSRAKDKRLQSVIKCRSGELLKEQRQRGCKKHFCNITFPKQMYDGLNSEVAKCTHPIVLNYEFSDNPICFKAAPQNMIIHQFQTVVKE